MKKTISAFVVFLCIATVYAQDRMLKADSAVTTKNTVTINGKLVPYTATAGTQPVWDNDGKVSASLFYTYYKRTNGGKTENRPLIMSFNGGPGSASNQEHSGFAR